MMKLRLMTWRSFGLVALFCHFIYPVSSLSSDGSSPDEKSAAAISKVTADDLNFFEQKIRPIFVAHCNECHSEAAAKANRLKGGLRVDSRDGLLRGGDSGPAIVPKDPAHSLLMQALRYDSLEMPPKGKLPANVIADFETWISRGAPDPRIDGASGNSSRQIDLNEGCRHWAYRPIQQAELPKVDLSRWEPRSPIDTLVLTPLLARGFVPALEADRITLIRRAYFDLIGLPPQPEEIDEFLNDPNPDAYERLVDRLMASPHFGLRWGRHWLSVARFGESMTLRGFVFPEAWRYRDYVIDAFNSEMPFDQFIIEQIAGDLLPATNLADQQRQCIATTYLALGNLNLEEQDKQQLRMDVVDEQLEAIAKGFLAQTIGCARCHDHKFDPIPTRDYYAMAGILANVKTLEDANVSKWLELPLPLAPAEESVMAEHEAAVALVQGKMKSVQEAQQKLTARTVVAAKDLPGIIVDDRQATIVGDWEQSQSVKPYIGQGYSHDKNSGKGDKTMTLLPELPSAGRYEVRLAYTAGDNRCDAVPVTIMSADGEKTLTINQKQRPPIDGLFVSLGQYRFEMNGQGYVIISTSGTVGHVIVDAVQFLPLEAPATESAADKNTASVEPTTSIESEKTRLTQELRSLQKELKQLQTTGPVRPRYMSVQEEPKIGDISVHLRGSVHNLGAKVPRGFLQVATNGDSNLTSTSQSGRREFGEWIASRDNPLTSRVIVNRIWHWLFGAGLTRTPDNFGTTGESPSHPELLDRLALRLLEHDWHLKPVIREIVLSRVYRQSSSTMPSQLTSDPENRCLSHQNRRRLDAECLLDAILTTSGQRNDELGGRVIATTVTEDYGYLHQSSRRAVYWPVFRNSLPEIFEAFDFPDPSVPTSSHSLSTVAPQSLFFLNNSWVAAQARCSAQRLLSEQAPDSTVAINRTFRKMFGRLPNDGERRLVEQTIADHHSPEDAWSLVIQALFASIDFRYVE